MYAKYRITQTAATVAALMGFDAPEHAEPANDIVLEKARRALPEGVASFDRVLLYNPDAVAFWLYPKYTDLLAPVLQYTDIQLPIESVMPSVTPVCFASMYTGATPDIHGIRKYTKPVLTTDTLFDAAVRAGKRCAIVAETDCSIAKIFLERDIDYFIYDTIDEVNAKALALIAEDKYDLITVYNGNYDATMHKHAPESAEALAELKRNSDDFVALVDAVKAHWGSHRTFYGYLPDHGCHEIDGGNGSHGLDQDEDMIVIHAFGTI